MTDTDDDDINEGHQLYLTMINGNHSDAISALATGTPTLIVQFLRAAQAYESLGSGLTYVESAIRRHAS